MQAPLPIGDGGGAPLDEDNRKILRASGTVVWLDASAGTLLKRRTEGDRPPLTGLDLKEEIEKLIREREAIYTRTAHETIDTDKLDIEEVLCELERIWRTVPRHDLR